MADVKDRFVDLADVLGDAGSRLAQDIRVAMARPRLDASHAAAMSRMNATLRALLPVDDEGQLVNEVVAFVEQNPDVVRVARPSRGHRDGPR